MNARDPRPDATVPGRVQHYVFRARPGGLLDGLGALGRAGLLLGTPRMAARLALCAVNAAAVAALVALGRGGIDAVAVAGGAVALVAGAAIAYALARRRMLAAGELEIVFWDV